MIDTREELVNALSEAAELEHGLLIQYLFAAFSLKRRVDEGITPVQQSLIVDWERTVLRVAHEEMYHLASVCNLLSAIGGAPQFGRPNFPQPTETSLVEEESYYPFDFQLERFNDSTLYRFVIFELPEGETRPSNRILKGLDYGQLQTLWSSATWGNCTARFARASSEFRRMSCSLVPSLIKTSRIGDCG